MASTRAVLNGTCEHDWNFGGMRPVNELTAADVAHITAYVRDRERQAGLG